MANIGRFIDRNPDLRVAGIASGGGSADDFHVDACLKISPPEEVAKSWMEAQCKQKMLATRGPLLKRTPASISQVQNVGELLSTDLKKSRFMQFKEKFAEAMYTKGALLGKVKPTHSIPNYITNCNTSFGDKSKTSDPLYPLVLPPKTAEQVNREYGTFHDKYIISHNHYFPAEQINRHYCKPFKRTNTFGIPLDVDDNGKFVKGCLRHCDQMVVVSKPQMDFINRTVGPLGRKYLKYSYDVPQDMTFGIKSKVSECDAKMLIEFTDPCVYKTELLNALSHLNKLRLKLHESQEFLVYDLLTMLEKVDLEKTGHLPLPKIFETMHKLNIRVDDDKMRRAVLHFNMIENPGCSNERVNYDQFCRLLMVQLPLPKTGNISTMPANVYNKETTYRLLCEDRLKPLPELRYKNKKVRLAVKLDEEMTHVTDLIKPTAATRLGLGPSEFQLMREKDKMQRIFAGVIGEDTFQSMWQLAIKKYCKQNERISITQFLGIMRQNGVDMALED